MKNFCWTRFIYFLAPVAFGLSLIIPTYSSFADENSIPMPKSTDLPTQDPLLQPPPQPIPPSEPPSMAIGGGYKLEFDPNQSPPAAIVAPEGTRLGPTVDPNGGAGLQLTVPIK